MPHLDDLALAGRVIAADQDAFDRLYQRAYPRVLAYASKRLGAKARAHDVTEASLVELFEGLPGYDGASCLDSFVFEIVRRRTENAVAAGVRPLARAGQGTARPAAAILG